MDGTSFAFWFLQMWGSVYSHLIENLTIYLMAALFLMSALNLALIRRRLWLKYWVSRKRGIFNMDKFSPNKKERKAYVERVISDRLTDLLEEEFFKDVLTRDEVNFWYRRFAHILSLPDLLPRCEKILKEKIKDRLKIKEELYKPVPFPSLDDDKPVEEKLNPLQRFFNRRAA